MYQSRFGEDLEERESRNHACWMFVSASMALCSVGRVGWIDTYFFRSVVYDKVHDELHISFLDLGYEIVDVGDGSVDGVDVFVVGDVVSHVCFWAFVYLGLFSLC